MPSIKPGTRQVDRSARGSTRTDRGVIDPPRGLLLADAIARERGPSSCRSDRGGSTAVLAYQRAGEWVAGLDADRVEVADHDPVGGAQVSFGS